MALSFGEFFMTKYGFKDDDCLCRKVFDVYFQDIIGMDASFVGPMRAVMRFKARHTNQVENYIVGVTIIFSRFHFSSNGFLSMYT